MNLGQHTVEDIEDVSNEQLVLLQIEALEASITLNEICNECDTLLEVSNNIKHLSEVIKAHGVSPCVESLIEDTEDVESSLESLGSAIVEIISKIWEALKSFLTKIIRVFYKVENVVQKKLDALQKADNVEWIKDNVFDLFTIPITTPGILFTTISDRYILIKKECAEQIAEFAKGEFSGCKQALQPFAASGATGRSGKQIAKKFDMEKKFNTKNNDATEALDSIAIALKQCKEELIDIFKLEKQIKKVKIRKLEITASVISEYTPQGTLNACSKILNISCSFTLRRLGTMNKVLSNMKAA